MCQVILQSFQKTTFLNFGDFLLFCITFAVVSLNRFNKKLGQCVCELNLNYKMKVHIMRRWYRISESYSCLERANHSLSILSDAETSSEWNKNLFCLP